MPVLSAIVVSIIVTVTGISHYGCHTVYPLSFNISSLPAFIPNIILGITSTRAIILHTKSLRNVRANVPSACLEEIIVRSHDIVDCFLIETRITTSWTVNDVLGAKIAETPI
jgi:hypothetical protein